MRPIFLSSSSGTFHRVALAAVAASAVACGGNNVPIGFEPEAGASGTSTGSSGAASGASGTSTGSSGTASGASGTSTGSSGTSTGSSGTTSDGGCQCTGPEPGVVSMQCSDGSFSGPVCATVADGTCSWQIRQCPATCPALGCNPQCPNGVLKDANGCDTCQCAPAADAGSKGLTWFYTCGYPVCQSPSADAGAGGLTDDAGAPCPAVGSDCTSAGARCGTASNFNCGATEVCSATDPTKGPDSCPISSRNFKTDIHYVGDAELERLHEEALHIRLATYHYKAQFEDPNPQHLGFIVEDDPRSPAVDGSFDRVDMYGYVSMVVATMQVQEKEIAELRRELAAERSGTCSTPASSP